MSELEELRKKRMAEIAAMQQQPSQQQELQKQAQAEELERQIAQIIQQIMTPEARERLGNIRFAKPEFARQIEIMLIQLSQTGRLPDKIDDLTFKNILAKLSSNKREIKIKK